MTLGQLIENCKHISGFTDSAYRGRWVNFLNAAIREFGRAQPWDGLEDTLDIPTNGSRYLILPHFVDTVVGLFNVTHANAIDRDSNFDREAPSAEALDTTGRVANYERLGDVACLSTSLTGHLWFNSSHASDTHTVWVTGYAVNTAASGTALERLFKTDTAYLSGTSPVTLSTLFASVLSISRATEANGDLYFYDAGSSDALVSYIPRDETVARFQRLRLLFTPSPEQIIRLRFRHRIPNLINDAASPHPSVKDDFVIKYALSLHYEEQEQFQKAQLAEAKASRIVEKEAHKDKNFNEPSERIIPQIWVDPDDWTKW